MKRALTLAVFSFLAVSCASKKTTATATLTENAQPANLNKTTCTQNKDVRTLEIKKTGNGCELFYTKFGTEKSVALGNGTTPHCSEVRDKISANLTRSGFKCE